MSDCNTRAPRDLLRAARLVSVLTIPQEAHAVPLARALAAGGIKMLEITLRTPAAAAAAQRIRDAVPGTVVGLGTVLTPADLALVSELDLAFAISPGATPALLDAAVALDVKLIPGVQTASELMTALERGFDVVKFFPAEPAGGIAALRALAGPFPRAGFCPTGGIAEDRVPDWLAEPNVLAVGGSWLAPAAEVERGDWSAITRRALYAMARLGRLTSEQGATA